MDRVGVHVEWERKNQMTKKPVIKIQRDFETQDFSYTMEDSWKSSLGQWTANNEGKKIPRSLCIFEMTYGCKILRQRMRQSNLYTYLKDLELDRFTSMALGQCAEQKTACLISFERLYNAWSISCMRGVLVHGWNYFPWHVNLLTECTCIWTWCHQFNVQGTETSNFSWTAAQSQVQRKLGLSFDDFNLERYEDWIGDKSWRRNSIQKCWQKSFDYSAQYFWNILLVSSVYLVYYTPSQRQLWNCYAYEMHVHTV